MNGHDGGGPQKDNSRFIRPRVFYTRRADRRADLPRAGGGFVYAGPLHEGFPHAVVINAEGYNAFVLGYRAGRGGEPAVRDRAAALAFLFVHAEALEVDTRHSSLWGRSAGSRMAAAVGLNGTAAYDGALLPWPSAVIMAYTGQTSFGTKEPPTFAIVGEDDRRISPSLVVRRMNAIRGAGRVVFRKIRNVDHGFGTGTATAAEGWIAETVRFWEKYME